MMKDSKYAIEKGSRHEYIKRTEDIEYPRNIEKYLEKRYPETPDLFTDEVFRQLANVIKLSAIVGLPYDPKTIVDEVIASVKENGNQSQDLE